jgi:hypothetical protein
VYVCVCVCVRERERERVSSTDEVGAARIDTVPVVIMCVCMCVIKGCMVGHGLEAASTTNVKVCLILQM